MGGFWQVMKAGLGHWITWAMYILAAFEIGLAAAATAKGYESLDLWLGAGILDLAGLYYNYVIGRIRVEQKQTSTSRSQHSKYNTDN
jgi:hypothetical protein